MTRPIPSKLSPQILDEASRWFVEFSEGTVTSHERKHFIAWLRTSPEHIRAYLQITAHWEDARSLGAKSAPDIDELVALARDDTADIVLLEPSESPRLGGAKPLTLIDAPAARRGKSNAARWFAFAASVLLAMVGAGYWFDFQRNTFSTDAAELRTITLVDGSTVELNVQSRIRVVLGTNERDIYLTRGQALFHVAKDSQRPFVVHTDGTKVRAVGTQFDVYRKDTGTIVTVLEGAVAVVPTPKEPESADGSGQGASKPETSPDGRHHRGRGVMTQSSDTLTQNAGRLLNDDPTAVLLTAGNQATVTTQGEVTPPRQADGAAATAWTRQQLILHNTPLAEVVAELNRYNLRPLVIVDPGIRSTRISGVFSSANPDSLLRGLQALGFKVRELHDRVEIASP